MVKSHHEIIRVRPRLSASHLWLLALTAVPLLLTLAWGPHFADDTYRLLAAAQGFGLSLRPSLLGWGVLRLLARMGADLAWWSLLGSGLGWGLTAVFLHLAIQQRSPQTAVLAPLLLAFAPVFLPALGTAVIGAVALGWLAIWLGERGAWGWQTAVLCLLPFVYFDLAMVVLLVLLWGWCWWQTGQMSLRAGGLLLVAITAATAAQLAWRQPIALGNGQWWAAWRQLVAENELFWLLPLLFGAGLWRQRGHVVAAWGALGLLFGGAMAVLVFYCTALFLGHGRTRKDTERVWEVGALFLLLLLAGGQVIWWVGRWQERPFAIYEIENEAAAWLHDHTAQSATVAAPARVGYLAKRPLAAASQQPDYVVVLRTLEADQLRRQAAFQENYEAVAVFATPYDSAAPLTVWGLRQTVYGLGAGQPLNVVVPETAVIVGSQLGQLAPGEPLTVTLWARAERPFAVQLRLISPDGQEWASSQTMLPVWAGTAAQTILLPTPADLPHGAYLVNFSLLEPESSDLLALYRNDDFNPLDRVGLGSVAVAWAKTAPCDTPTTDDEPQTASDDCGLSSVVRRLQTENLTFVPIQANFGNQITLLGYALNDNFARGGEPLRLTLFWEGQRSPDNNYVVFVHLLDEAGQLVTNHDGVPVNGRYPTTAFRPGDIVADEHPLLLDGGLAAGSYRLAVGLYLPETGERLPVWGADGVEMVGGVVELTAVEIPFN
ncbi:MAG: hypothetical protein KC423_15460 [Anaerolineales bacterium]|nr:hypothetical protein [Anaerolineales bacterium]